MWPQNSIKTALNLEILYNRERSISILQLKVYKYGGAPKILQQFSENSSKFRKKICVHFFLQNSTRENSENVLTKNMCRFLQAS